MKSVSVPRWVVMLAAASAWACDEPLKKAELVEEPRVLAARIEVEGDPARAAPFPGESATVRFLVAAPELEPALGFALVACHSTEANAGLPSCHSAPFAESERLEPQPGAPALSFELPEPDPDAAPRLLVKGVICPNGAPRVSDNPGSCASGDHALPVSLEAELASADGANLNPSFASGELLFDGQSLPEAATLELDCAGSGLVEVRGKSKHRLRIELPESARDPVPKDNAYAPDRESLLVSHFSSGGELARAFSPIPYDRPEISAEVEWLAPDSAGASGQLVRFWFVVRDLRGGSDFVERAVCVIP